VVSLDDNRLVSVSAVVILLDDDRFVTIAFAIPVTMDVNTDRSNANPDLFCGGRHRAVNACCDSNYECETNSHSILLSLWALWGKPVTRY
jgi:hypothetical protein